MDFTPGFTPYALLPAPKRELPEGLEFHCERCRVVIPADAPRPDVDDDFASAEIERQCEFIARHKLAWFSPKASPRQQHIMASAAWELVYHRQLKAEKPHPQSIEYLRRFKLQPEEHWKASAASANGDRFVDAVMAMVVRGKKIPEIARELGRTPNAIKQAIGRNRSALYGKKRMRPRLEQA